MKARVARMPRKVSRHGPLSVKRKREREREREKRRWLLKIKHRHSKAGVVALRESTIIAIRARPKGHGSELV